MVLAFALSCNYVIQFTPPTRLLIFQIWDGVSSRCVATYIAAHGGDDVCSVVFSRNGKYLLTSGKDSVARLWDLAGSGQPLLSYTGAELSGKQVI